MDRFTFMRIMVVIGMLATIAIGVSAVMYLDGVMLAVAGLLGLVTYFVALLEDLIN